MSPATSPPTSVVISGASRGLGAALARRFAAPGVTLGLIARDRQALEAVAADCAARGAATRIAAHDIRDATSLEDLLRGWDAALPVDLVVANAGTSAGTTPDGAVEDPREAIRQIEVNLLGAIHLVAPLLPAMIGRGRGRIGLVSSLAAFRPLPDSPGYCASKSGLWAWGEALRPVLRPHGITVTTIAPGFFASAMGDRYRGPKPLRMGLEAATDHVHRALVEGRSRAVFPLPLAVLLRLLDLLPAPLADRAMGLFRFSIEPPQRP